jgi:4-hydroxybutyryl-CoA dehydratase/vinylacetyl-CoA-Delta-isomerase
MHGAGSPQAQRIQIARGSQLEEKKRIAKRLANIKEGEADRKIDEPSDYFDRIFGSDKKKKK